MPMERSRRESRAEPSDEVDVDPFDTTHGGSTPRPEPPDRNIIDELRRNRLSAALFGSAEDLRIGRFVVDRTLGRGGMGTVLEAYDEALDRKVALKLLHANTDEHRLLREAQALARLSHPNVVQVHEVGNIDGQHFIAMELVPGQTLADWQQRPRSWRECLDVYLQAGRGLAAAHARGLIHRDFKPANCILDDTGCAKVLDFGLARDVALIADVEFDSTDTAMVETTPEHDAPRMRTRDSSSSGGASASRSALMQELTRTGTLLGTIAYMDPEQLMGGSADARSDQFAFCVSLFEALYGTRPFTGNTAMALLYQINEQQLAKIPTRPDLPVVPAWVHQIVVRGLSPTRAKRHPSMEALLVELERTPLRRRRLRAIATGLGTLAVAAGAAAAWPDEGPCEGMAHAPAPAWTAQQRARVERAVLATELPAASQLWSSLELELDRYAGEWTRARAEACDAAYGSHTAATRTYDLQLACLDGNMRRMSALVEQFAAADPRTVASAVQAVQALPSAMPCLDAEQLHVQIANVPEQLHDLDKRVRAAADEAWALYHAGRAPEGLAAVDQALVDAQRLPEHSSARAEALLVRGMLQRMMRVTGDSRRDLVAAIEGAESSRDVTLQLDVLWQLVMLEGLDRNHPSAQAWLALARGKLPLTTDRARRERQLRYASAYVEYRAGDPADAVDRLEPLIAEVREDHPEARLELADALKLLGETEHARGRLDEAWAALDESLTLHESSGAYREVAATLHNMGLVKMDQGDYAAAQHRFERARRLLVSIFGEGTSAGLRTRIALARLHAMTGDLDAALTHADAARRELAQTPAVKPSLRGRIMMMSGALSQNEGRCEDAIGLFEQAHEAFSAAAVPDHLELAMVDSNRADCLHALGRREDARGGYQRALVVLEERARSDDPRWVYPLLGLGRLELEGGAPTQALVPLERALRVQLDGPENPALLAVIHWLLGRSLVESGTDRPRGLELVERGYREFESLGDDHNMAQIDAWRAKEPRLDDADETVQQPPR